MTAILYMKTLIVRKKNSLPHVITLRSKDDVHAAGLAPSRISEGHQRGCMSHILFSG